MYSYKFLLFAFLLPSFCAAQTNFKSGYVISLKGDTVKGYIDYREWDKNPVSFSFKRDLNAIQPQTFTVDNAGGFGITGLESYQRFTASASTDHIDLADITSETDTTHRVVTAFFKALVMGNNLNLFAYRDDLKIRFYVVQSSAEPEELAFHLFKDADGKLGYSNRFRAQLAYFAQKFKLYTNATAIKIAGADYSETDLIKIVKLLNNKVSDVIPSTALGGASFFVGGGVNSNTLKFEGETVFASNATITNTPLPFLSVGVDLFINKTVRRIFLRGELLLMTDSHSVDAPTTGIVINGGNAHVAYKQYTASFNPQFGYNFYNTRAVKAYLLVGAALNISAYNNYIYTETYGNGFGSITKSKFPDFASIWLGGITANTGVILNQKIDIFAGVAKSGRLNNEIGFQSNYSSIKIGLHYFLGNNKDEGVK